jgi:hypothetical protein
VATRGKYRKLTNDQWRELEPILTKERTGAGRPPASPRRIFNTLLCALWDECSFQEVKRQGYTTVSVMTRMLWKWADSGKLERAWRAYLKRLPKREISLWRAIFKTYADSWKDEKRSKLFASRVHSLWFKKMHRVLNRI